MIREAGQVLWGTHLMQTGAHLCSSLLWVASTLLLSRNVVGYLRRIVSYSRAMLRNAVRTERGPHHVGAHHKFGGRVVVMSYHTVVSTSMRKVARQDSDGSVVLSKLSVNMWYTSSANICIKCFGHVRS